MSNVQLLLYLSLYIIIIIIIMYLLFINCRGYQQQDAHEFMHYLLDRVHSELLLSRMAYNGKNTIVTGIFGGLLESHVCVNMYCFLRRKTWPTVQVISTHVHTPFSPIDCLKLPPLLFYSV